MADALQELPKKRNRKDEDPAESLNHYNLALLCYIHRLEMEILMSSRSYAKTKVKSKNYLLKLSQALDRAEIKAVCLPDKLFQSEEESLNLECLWQEVEVERISREEHKNRQKKAGRPKKQPDAFNSM